MTTSTSSLPLRLYSDSFWISPYVFSTFVALREKGLPFDVVTVSLAEHAQKRPEYGDRSITGRVPALQHGDFWLGESSAIIEYLEEVFPPGQYPRLLPGDVRERARARQILAWIRSDLGALRDERPTTSMFYERATEPLTRAGQEAADKLIAVSMRLVPEGGGALFREWCIADTDLAFMLHRLLLNGHEVPARVRRFAEVQWQRPSVRAYVERERLPYVPY